MNWKALPPSISSKKFVQNSDGSYVLKYKIKDARFVTAPPKKNYSKQFVPATEVVSAMAIVPMRQPRQRPASGSRVQIVPMQAGKRQMMKVLNSQCYNP